jgi:sporulation protein YlmC with PRC-barrel domain
MKLASAVIKLPVISVNEGEQIAVVRDMFVDRKTKRIEYLSVVKSAEDIIPSVISFRDIMGISNEYFIVVPLITLKNIDLNGDLFAQLEGCLSLPGRMVLSVSGDGLDRISDYSIDVKTGEIKKLILANGKEIAGNKLVTLSAKFIFVNLPGGEETSALDEGTLAYLAGKTVNTVVASADGTFTIESGTVLTNELSRRLRRTICW